MIRETYDVVVIGGGVAGVCAALASARHGAQTLLVHDRPVLGGNASSEFRMHICGADRHASRPNLRETGILEEILLEVKRTNHNPDFWALDAVLWEKCTMQANLTLHLNAHVTDVDACNGRIERVSAVQMTTERRYEFFAPLFVDATGDASIAHRAGADTRTGREGKREYNERWAPDEADECTMGSSLLFTAKDMGHPVPFEKPDWAYTFSEEDLNNRDHSEITSGYWWIELGGDGMNTIDDAEAIRDELLKSLYGIWDHIKNGGEHGAANYALNWMAFLPGKRESRRVMGDYVLCEQDLISERIFEDAIAYGGWSMDCHVPGGLRSSREEPTQYLGEFGAYTIPYRCLYSRNIENLFAVGRPISVSHMAFSSTRVMATCAVVGQAGGTAAALAAKKGLLPRAIGAYTGELQMALMRDDCWIPGFVQEDPQDAVRTAMLSASASLPGHEPQNAGNGFSRTIGDAANQWAAPLSPSGAWLRARFAAPEAIEEIAVRFDSNLSREIMPTISDRVRTKQREGVPETLVRDFRMEGLCGGEVVFSRDVRNNAQRFLRFDAGGAVMDELLLTVYATNGDPYARVFELNAYRARHCTKPFADVLPRRSACR